MKKRINKEFLELNESEKIFILCEIFIFWSSKNIFSKEKAFMPESVGIKNKDNVIKILMYLRTPIKNNNTLNFMLSFEKINFNEKLDFMIFMFDHMSNNNNIITNITDNFNFKDLSEEILKYKLSL